MTAEQIIDHIRSHPDHPPTISTAEWQSILILFRDKNTIINGLHEIIDRRDVRELEQLAEIQRLQSVIAQLLDEKKQTDGR